MTTRAERRAEMASNGKASPEPAKAPTAAPAPTPTAQQRLDALNARRAAGGGFLVPRPAGGFPKPADFLKYLEEVAAVGGAGDVEIAWHYCCQDSYFKEKLRNAYDRLCHEAGARMFKLTEEVAEERRRAQIAYEAEQAKRKHAAEIRAAEARLAELKATG